MMSVWKEIDMQINQLINERNKCNADNFFAENK